MFTGREYYPHLWLYDYRNRWYDPQLGRFLQPDPTGFDAGDMNLFRYCGDDPVDRSDPTGLLDTSASIANHLRWLEGGSQLSSEQYDALKQGQMRIVLELIAAGDRHISQKDVFRKDGVRAVALTEVDFSVREPVKQKDGSWLVTGVYTLNVRYADGLGTTAGPKSLNHAYKEEWRHAEPFDRWYGRALETVKAMNEVFHYTSPSRAQRALDSQLRPSFERAHTASEAIHHDGSPHNAPYDYEE
jgi:RHS repeat-associated protein